MFILEEIRGAHETLEIFHSKTFKEITLKDSYLYGEALGKVWVSESNEECRTR